MNDTLPVMKSKDMVRIVIADDHQLFLEALGALLSSYPGLEIVRLCRDGTTAIECVRSDAPDILLLDINMAPLSGLETAAALAGCATRIIGLSMYTSATYVKCILQKGGYGYISKDASVEEIIAGIYTVMRGEQYICRKIKDEMTREEYMSKTLQLPSKVLSARELEVAVYTGKGYSSKATAEALRITVKTVEAHRYNMLKKLRLRNRNELINYLNQHGDYYL